MANSARKKWRFGALAFALFLLVATAGYHIGAGEKDNRQGDGKAASSGDKGTVSNSKWFADPKRGWIRSDKREEQQKRRAAEHDRGENSAREKAGRVIWDY
ncbi:MAG TPA: hypothetical protein VGL70_23910 [Candidatus Binatia bacterium]|jgi:hypothetical protein